MRRWTSSSTSASERSWRVAFLAAREAEMPRYAARGLHGFYLGDEAIIECDEFSLDGPAMKSVRAAVRRVARTYRFKVIRESEASDSLVTQLNAISEQWRGKAPERGFTMSLSQDIEGHGKNPEFLLCVALDEHDRPGGFLRIVPAYGEDFGYTLDLMRHLPDAPNGMTEYLIAQSALALGQEGIVRLSMNFAMWGRLYEQGVHYTFGQRVAKRAIDVLNPFFQIKSLHDFNAKFSPFWLSRVLVYQELTDLPRVGLLYAGAEGFLALPGIGELFVPKAVGGVSAEQASRGLSCVAMSIENISLISGPTPIIIVILGLGATLLSFRWKGGVWERQLLYGLPITLALVGLVALLVDGLALIPVPVPELLLPLGRAGAAGRWSSA